MSVQYTREDAVQYTREYAVDWGMLSTPGDILSALRGYLEYTGGYHEYTRNITSTLGGFQ